MRDTMQRWTIVLLAALVLVLTVQSVCLWLAVGRLQRTAESAEAAAIDALEVGKQLRAAGGIPATEPEATTRYVRR